MSVRLVVVAAALTATVASAQSAEEALLPPPPMVEAEPVAAPSTEVRSERPAPNEKVQRLNRLTWGPLVGPGGAVALEYERAVTEKLSLFVGPRVGFLGGVGVGGSTGARFFLAGSPAPTGVWFGPEFYFDYFTSRTVVNGSPFAKQDLTAVMLAMLGYTWTHEKGFTASVGAGAGAGWADWQRSGLVVNGNIFTDSGSFRGVIPSLALHANLGYAF